jgi:hypothetical protein
MPVGIREHPKMKRRYPHKCSDTNETLSAAQKAAIDARLAEAREDIKQGRISEPFGSAQDLARSLRKGLQEGAIRRAKRDQRLDEEWMSLEDGAAGGNVR